MKNNKEKRFDAVSFFRKIKDKLSKKMTGMTLEEQREFLRKIKEGQIKIV